MAAEGLTDGKCPLCDATGLRGMDGLRGHINAKHPDMSATFSSWMRGGQGDSTLDQPRKSKRTAGVRKSIGAGLKPAASEIVQPDPKPMTEKATRPGRKTKKKVGESAALVAVPVIYITDEEALDEVMFG